MEETTEEQSQAINAHNSRLRIRQDGDLRRVLDTVEGRRFVWRVLKIAGIGKISFSPDDISGLITAFNEGQRNVGNQVWQDILRVVPEKFMLMQRESVSEAKSDQAELKKMMEEKNNE